MTITCNKNTKQFEPANCKLHCIKAKYLHLVEQIIEKKGNVYMGFDILDAPVGYKKYANKFYNLLCNLSADVSSNFAEYDFNSAIWTALCFKNEEVSSIKIMDQIYKQKIAHEFMPERTVKIVVNQVMIVCVNLFCQKAQSKNMHHRNAFLHNFSKLIHQKTPADANKNANSKDESHDIQLPSKETVDLIEELNEIMQIHAVKMYAQFSQILMHKSLFVE